MKTLFKVLVLVAYTFSPIQGMESSNQPSDKETNFKFHVKCRYKYTVEEEFIDNYLETEQFREELEAIVQNIAVQLQDLVLEFSAINPILLKTTPSLFVNIHALIEEEVKKTSTPIKWHSKAMYKLKKSTSQQDLIHTQYFVNKLESIISRAKNQLRDIENLIRIILEEESYITINIIIYKQLANFEDQSWTNFFNNIINFFTHS